jgi:DNA-binding transcriptional LysR family regulator
MKLLNRVHLNGLRAAEAVGRLGSLPAAAAELGVTAGAVSQHVTRLEAQLGRTLFERTSRGMAASATAAPILAQLTRGMAELDAAVSRGLRNEADTLTLSVAPVFAAKWLVPRLVRFGRLQPTVRVRLEATTAFADPDRDDVDLAIRVGHGNWPGVAARLLLHHELFPVAAPALAATLKAPQDLLRAPIVRDVHSPHTWSVWLAPFGIDEAALPEGPGFTDAALALDAVIAGQGVMLAWNTLAQDALADGRLVAPFPQRARSGQAYWLISSETRRPTRAMRAFAEWLADELAEVAKG